MRAPNLLSLSLSLSCFFRIGQSFRLELLLFLSPLKKYFRRLSALSKLILSSVKITPTLESVRTRITHGLPPWGFSFRPILTPSSSSDSVLKSPSSFDRDLLAASTEDVSSLLSLQSKHGEKTAYVGGAVIAHGRQSEASEVGKKKTITAPDMDQKFEISRGSATVPDGGGGGGGPKQVPRQEEEEEDAAGGDINNKRIFLLWRREGGRPSSLLVALIPIPAVQKTAAAAKAAMDILYVFLAFHHIR